MRAAVCIVLLAAAILAPRSLPADNPTRIYVFAAWELPVRSWVPILCDGRVVAKIKRGRFFAINVAPGQHILSEQDGVPAFVDAHSGEDAYVQLQQHVEDSSSGESVIPMFQIVAANEARKQIIHLAYIGADKVYAPSVSKEDPTRSWQPQVKTRGENQN
jgi:hypothetical protein